MATVKYVTLDTLNKTLSKICEQSDNRFSRIITTGTIEKKEENDVEKTYLVLTYNDDTDTNEHKLKIDVTELGKDLIDDESVGADKTLSAQKIYRLIEEASGVDMSEYLTIEDVYEVVIKYGICDSGDVGAVEITTDNIDLYQQNALSGVTLRIGDYVKPKKTKGQTLFYKRTEYLVKDTVRKMLDDIISNVTA